MPSSAAALFDLMKSSYLLFIVALMSREGGAGPMDSLYGFDGTGFAPYDLDSSLSPGYAGDFRDAESPSESTRDKAGPRKGGRLWVPVPSRQPQARGWEGYGDPVPQPSEYPPGQASLYDQFRPSADHSGSNWTGSAGHASMPDGLYSDGSGQRYRFRGDDRLGTPVWGEESRHGGYRFRPLTEQERERQFSGSPWRPPKPARREPLDRRESPGIPKEEAYGYHPDGWFQRYYGERP